MALIDPPANGGVSWLRTHVILVVIVIVSIVLFREYHDEIRDAAKFLVTRFGFPMMFFLVFLADGLVQPVPPDLIVFGSGFGGANPLKAGIVAGLGSSCGGVLGYLIGRLINPWTFRRLFGSKLMRNGRDLYRSYGTLTIAIAAVTPIPYSFSCYLGGLYRMSLPSL
ncbi:MAG TPA: VTT domain-containing protein, partial [Candidatus Ozemobacteraceae bacterium]|nr:VTT domain-containing protein [Candidatus Ozemobacteraceae bacterium]